MLDSVAQFLTPGRVWSKKRVYLFNIPNIHIIGGQKLMKILANRAGLIFSLSPDCANAGLCPAG